LKEVITCQAERLEMTTEDGDDKILILDCEIGRKFRAGLQDVLGATSYKKTSSLKNSYYTRSNTPQTSVVT
jgi:hypothetical protein